MPRSGSATKLVNVLSLPAFPTPSPGQGGVSLIESEW